MSKRAHQAAFDKAWKFTDKIPGSFTRLNGAMLYGYASEVPINGTIVEVGVDQGRSASLLMAATLGRGVWKVLVDSWESVLIENKAKVERMIELVAPIDDRIIIMNAKSVDAARGVQSVGGRDIDLLHIDANHYDDNPANDIKAWTPMLKSGGIICLHDYQASFAAVTEAIDTLLADWEDLGTFDSLAVRMKP